MSLGRAAFDNSVVFTDGCVYAASLNDTLVQEAFNEDKRICCT